MAVMESCLERRIPDNKGGDTRQEIIVNSLGESNLVVAQALFDS